MKIIGLCGGSGSGKTSVARSFSKYNVPTIDADIIYKEITSYNSDCMKALVSAFGDSVQNQDGSLNRSKMREIAFVAADSKENLTKLNSITHSFVLSEIDKRIEEYASSGFEAVIADVPLMFESEFNKKCDFLIAVTSDEETRISRILLRDKISREQAKARIAHQIDNSELINKVDYVIENNGDLASLEAKIDEVYKMIFNK